MNQFVILVFFALASFAWADYKKMIADPEMSKECMEQSKLDPAVFEEAKEDPTKLETQEFKCFIDCMGKKMGAFTEDVKFMPNNQQQLPYWYSSQYTPPSLLPPTEDAQQTPTAEGGTSMKFMPDNQQQLPYWLPPQYMPPPQPPQSPPAGPQQTPTAEGGTSV